MNLGTTKLVESECLVNVVPWRDGYVCDVIIPGKLVFVEAISARE